MPHRMVTNAPNKWTLATFLNAEVWIIIIGAYQSKHLWNGIGLRKAHAYNDLLILHVFPLGAYI